MNFTVNVTQLLLALEGILVPIILGWIVNAAWQTIQPEVVKLLGQKNADLLQNRFDKLAQHAIGYAVQAGADRIARDGGITFDTRNVMVSWATDYANAHASELAEDAGDVVEKLLARFDTHPAVQGLLLPPIPVATPAAA